MRIALASPSDFPTVIGLIDEAAAWLAARGIDQWARPWPDRARRDLRVQRGLEGRKTWLVWDGEKAAATITATPKRNPAVWSGGAACDLRQRAVYAHRLITARPYAGLGLGAQLIDWAGRQGRHEYGAEWIRIDVWTTNTALHDYYRKTGFEPCGGCPDPDYPSGKLFQKPVARIQAGIRPLFDPPATEPVLATRRVPELVPA